MNARTDACAAAISRASQGGELTRNLSHDRFLQPLRRSTSASAAHTPFLHCAYECYLVACGEIEIRSAKK